MAAAAGGPTALAGAASRHERVPLKLIHRFPLNPRTASQAHTTSRAHTAPVPRVPTGGTRKAAARTSPKPSGEPAAAGGGVPLAWLLPAAACACLLLGALMVRFRV